MLKSVSLAKILSYVSKIVKQVYYWQIVEKLYIFLFDNYFVYALNEYCIFYKVQTL